ncbi:hypothetical protein FSP39_012023 [Pinctada imbricata]|uniref:Metalloendopeptidase n=1 Tax=Pinctada imbricata TaxID=66713 RepID=A0AA89BYZ3_PINIB|nr:hypothetical protein FSP39_012023 [Pinctada imbricata]
MSQEKVELRNYGKHKPVVSSRTTVINRGGSLPFGGGVTSQRSSTLRMSMGGGPSYAAGTLAGLSHKGVNDVISTRDKEKKDMQGLNERFASYIEKVRFLEAQNKALLAEIERLKKLKGFDVSEIKELYENELAECRNVIDDLSKEKAKFDSTLVGLQDALDDEKRERFAAEKENAELRNKLDRLNDQIGEYEGEVATLRGRVNGLEDEVGKLRAANKRLQEDICRLRADLDEETRKRIEAECKAQAIEEDLTFRLNVADAEIKELTALLDRDKGTEMRDIWKGEMSKAVSELQKEYDNQLAAIRADCEMRMESQLRELQAGVNRDNMEAAQAKEEVKKLKSKMGGMNPRIGELEAENAKLLAQLRQLQIDYGDLEADRDREVSDLKTQIETLSMQMEAVMQELQVLQDAKLSLELEISCYRKLLEGEEQSLKHVVESASGARSKGANQLADIVQKSNSGKSDKPDDGGMVFKVQMKSPSSLPMKETSPTDGSNKGLSSSESVGKMVVNRTCRGNITFDNAKADGTVVTLANNTAPGRGSKSTNIQGWKIRRFIKEKEKYSYEIKDNITLGPGQTLNIYTQGSADEAGPNDIVANIITWGGGAGSFQLFDKENDRPSTIAHEMAHTIGITHEQKRSDRDGYVTVHFDAIVEDKVKNFDKDQTYNYHPYDIESIMHYQQEAFSNGNGNTIDVADENLAFLIRSRGSMTYYDVSDILTAYKCSSKCNKKTAPACKYGILNHKCECYCMDGFVGVTCDTIETDSDCGGSIDLTHGEEKIITSPNYPEKYPTGKLCRWVVRNSDGWLPQIIIEDLHLTANTVSHCYHWLEIQYNLPGQTGIRKCGEIVNEKWSASTDSGGTMILTFDSKYVANRPAEAGFRARLKLIGKGCRSEPCVHGKCIQTSPDAKFQCICDIGFKGELCDQMKEKTSLRCSFEVDTKCIFTNIEENDDFQWSLFKGASTSAGTGPTHAYKGQYYMLAEMSNPRIPNDKARLVTKVKFPGVDRCLRFYYSMFGQNVGTLNVLMAGKGRAEEIVWTKSGNQGDRWKEAAIFIPSTTDLKLIIEAVRGNDWDSDIAIDEIIISYGKCREVSKECLTTSNGAEYKGTLSITENGQTCKDWKSVSHSFGTQLNNNVNYCRNPDNKARPWCYTGSGTGSWEYCDVPQCDNDECLHSKNGYEYQGVVSTTKTGRECQRWDSQFPHDHKYSSLSAHENFCRNPNGEQPFPWCYTTDSKIKWDYCDIERCSSSHKPHECKKTEKGIEYFGTISKTMKGRTCKRWDKAGSTKAKSSLGDQENYCRNVGKRDKPWCFTDDPKRKWHYCDIPSCVKPDLTECLQSEYGLEYSGKLNTTEQGLACLPWTQTDLKFYGLNLKGHENYCRNIVIRERPWCYVEQGWDYCKIPRCTASPKECLEDSKGEKYFGTTNTAKDGFMCRRWDSDWVQKKTQGNFMFLKDQENYCRWTKMMPGPWCFTTNPNPKNSYGHEFCNIPYC